MLLVCYGTRPELIKVSPLMKFLKEKGVVFKTLFSGQHETLIEVYKELFIEDPTFTFKDIMKHNQSLCDLFSGIHTKMSKLLRENEDIKDVLVQGDTTTAVAIGLAAFHEKRNVIHLEAGLRTYDKQSPFPEEMNRVLLSSISSIHLCPTMQSVGNLKKEGIEKNVYQVGNTIVDSFKMYSDTFELEKEPFILVTLHRRENKGTPMENMWEQLKMLNIKCKYIVHPSLREKVHMVLEGIEHIELLEPVEYGTMLRLINASIGIISDSGGIQEEAVCANKKILVCRNTTERNETIESGYGLLVGDKILENINFLFEKNHTKEKNPYGEDVCSKIFDILRQKNIVC
jgi:UDP-N-acetylglucosamine 2-epimerase (non-hydrolysing)